jgi:hypothetical protein
MEKTGGDERKNRGIAALTNCQACFPSLSWLYTVNRHLPKLISIWQREATKIDTYVVESLTTSLKKQTRLQ